MVICMEKLLARVSYYIPDPSSSNGLFMHHFWGIGDNLPDDLFPYIPPDLPIGEIESYLKENCGIIVVRTGGSPTKSSIQTSPYKAYVLQDPFVVEDTTLSTNLEMINNYYNARNKHIVLKYSEKPLSK